MRARRARLLTPVGARSAADLHSGGPSGSARRGQMRSRPTTGPASARRASCAMFLRRGGQMDAIQLLKKDHRQVETLFKEFEGFDEENYDARRARKIVDRIISELAMHSAVEETLF